MHHLQNRIYSVNQNKRNSLINNYDNRAISALPFLLIHTDYGDRDLFEINNHFFTNPPVELRYIRNAQWYKPIVDNYYNSQGVPHYKGHEQHQRLSDWTFASHNSLPGHITHRSLPTGTLKDYNSSIHSNIAGIRRKRKRRKHKGNSQIEFTESDQNNNIANYRYVEVKYDSSCKEENIISSLVKHADKHFLKRNKKGTSLLRSGDGRLHKRSSKIHKSKGKHHITVEKIKRSESESFATSTDNEISSNTKKSLQLDGEMDRQSNNTLQPQAFQQISQSANQPFSFNSSVQPMNNQNTEFKLPMQINSQSGQFDQQIGQTFKSLFQPTSESFVNDKPASLFNFSSTGGTLVPNPVSSVMQNFFPPAFQNDQSLIHDIRSSINKLTLSENTIINSPVEMPSDKRENEVDYVKFRKPSVTNPPGVFSLKTTDIDTALKYDANIQNNELRPTPTSSLPQIGFDKINKALKGNDISTGVSSKPESRISRIRNRLSLKNPRPFTADYDEVKSLPDLTKPEALSQNFPGVGLTQPGASILSKFEPASSQFNPLQSLLNTTPLRFDPPSQFNQASVSPDLTPLQFQPRPAQFDPEIARFNLLSPKPNSSAPKFNVGFSQINSISQHLDPSPTPIDHISQQPNQTHRQVDTQHNVVPPNKIKKPMLTRIREALKLPSRRQRFIKN
ncbi:hypothetical protein GJ496_010988 [Pomphorhynchus laevis]|nr:hypothetical protein GJ496_010988 [Pomphorhynchus laevis]